MSTLNPHLQSDLPRSHSATSIAASVTTYHSFHDVELSESTPVQTPIETSTPQWKLDSFQPVPMKRHDSGYASIPSGSRSGGSHSSGHGVSTTPTGPTASQFRPRTRPSIRRAARSSPSPRGSIASASSHQPQLHLSQRPQSQQNYSFFHFPAPVLSASDPAEPTGQHRHHHNHDDSDDDTAAGSSSSNQHPLYPPPPQTTHYWTSDRTRRLEYAAIDAASRGVKGWILRHVVPDCFVPKEKRRLAFDDDTGSVRRYRLELECEDECEKMKRGGGAAGGKHRAFGWLLGGRPVRSISGSNGRR
ncbi:hypothetical protein BX600DRAFT_517685 [Xylariales sp. PMI_506]|nr:hypothetical protein BX600DRAFT_517685 [Xylariales sp. PMI_506]